MSSHLFPVADFIAICPELLKLWHVLDTWKVTFEIQGKNCNLQTWDIGHLVVCNLQSFKVNILETPEICEPIVRDVDLLEAREVVQTGDLPDSVALDAEQPQRGQLLKILNPGDLILANKQLRELVCPVS